MVSHTENIKERCSDLAASVIAATQEAAPSAANYVMSKQAVRAASTTGVNCLSAETASNSQEFTGCMDLVFSNLRELLYWINLMKQTRVISGEVADVLQEETEEIQDEIAPLVFSSASSG
ncbi:four helix bundle protein [Patescibacteria group bacterium]